MRKKTQEAYLTVYLALIMTVLLSLCLTLIEGVRQNTIRLETEFVTDIGLNSVLAEYHRELLEQYNLFAIDSSYGTDMASVANTKRHLQQYMERNLSVEGIFLYDWLYKDFLGMSILEIDITKVRNLTDDNGTVFRKCAVDALEDDIGLTLLLEIKEWLDVVEENQLEERDISQEKQEIDKEIQEYNGKKVQISEEEWKTVKIENPTAFLEEKRKSGILKSVIPEDKKLSGKSISEEILYTSRKNENAVSQGNMPVLESDFIDDLAERFLFQEYLLRYMDFYGKEEQKGQENALSYQLEYLIAGKESDMENLKAVAERLCAFREVANVTYILTDEEKCAAAEMMGTIIAYVLLVPEIASLLKMTLLFGWAYAESIYDVKTILAGGKIPLIKDEQSWHYSLENALNMEEKETDTVQEGLSYQDYLRIFMMLTEKETITNRAMNMVEADIRMTPGNANFRLDGCFTNLEAYIQIQSANGYICEITRQKGYF